jgi:hypothetical protein
MEKLVGFGVFWGFIVLLLSVLMEPTPENFTLAVSIIISGGYTCILYLTKGYWLPRLVRHPVRNAVILGSLNAALIETVFLVIEKTFGAEGVAAHSNLLVDLLMTMPWYIGLVWLFVRVQKIERFSPTAVLLLGAVYELGADGIVGGQIIPLIMGEPVNIFTSLLLMLVLAFWQFIPVYSSLLLPPAWILETVHPKPSLREPRWTRGLLPLLWLIPFTIYLVIFIFVMSFLGA